MIRRFVAVAAFLCITVSVRPQSRGAVDWIFVVDTSKSMRGVGGTQDIFNDVRASLDTFIGEASDGDSVAIYTFDRDARLHSAMEIRGSAREDLHAIVAGLVAEGDRTHVGAAIAKGLERAESLRQKGDSTRVRSVVLFTDGREDVHGIENPISIDSNLRHVADTFVFFVSMGEHEPQLDAFAAATERTSVLKAPSREAIARVAYEIREKIKPPPPPPPRLRPRVVAPPSKPKPSLAARIAAWAIPIAILIVVGIVGVRAHRRGNRLEGEIEILRPRVESSFIGLPRLGANEIALSMIVPIDALAGSDARLFMKRKDGAKSVWISAESGSLRVNDVETPMSELFDADTIAIGDAKLRFNRVGHERPDPNSGHGPEEEL